jgi:hypothetical protein
LSRQLLAGEFGEAVARIVEEITDDESAAKAERKRRVINHAPKKSARAKVLKFPNATSTLCSTAASLPPD